MSMKALFQSKTFQGSLNTSISEVIDALYSEEDLMFRFSIDLKNTNYEWGKGWINGMSNDQYNQQVRDFVEKVDFLEMTNKTEIGFKGEGWSRGHLLNGQAYVYPHPMGWNIVIPVNKIEPFMEAWCAYQNEENIRMIRVHDIYEVVDVNNEEKLKQHVKDKTRAMLNRRLQSVVHNDKKFNHREWLCHNKKSMESFWLKDATTFDYLRNHMRESDEQKLLKAIVEMIAPMSLEVYEKEFVSKPFFETRLYKDNVIAYRMKSPSKRRAMSKANKAYAEEQGISCE